MTDALAVNDQAPGYRTRRTHHRGFGNSVSINLTHAKVARAENPPTAKPKLAAAVAPIVQPSISISRAPVVGRAITSYDDVIDAFRDRVDELEISRPEIDRLTGLADAHASMLLTKSCMKVFGPVSLPLMLKVLGLRFRIEEDPEQTARTIRRRERRVRTHVHYRPEFPPISGRVNGWLFGYPAPIAGKSKR